MFRTSAISLCILICAAPMPTRQKTSPPRESKAVDWLLNQPTADAQISEMALLGALMLDGSCIPELSAIIQGPEAFGTAAHQAIYSGIIDSYTGGKHVNLAILAERLSDKAVLADVGGTRYLEKLATETPGPAAALHYAKKIAERHRRRMLARACSDMLWNLHNSPDQEAQQIATDAMKKMADATSDASEVVAISMAEVIKLVFDSIAISKPAFYTTVFPTLDRRFFGIPKDGITCIAGEQSSGKTTFGLQLLTQVCDNHGIKGWVFSCEQSAERIGATILSQVSMTSVHAILNSGRKPTSSEWARLVGGRVAAESFPLHMVEQGLHAGQIYEHSRIAARQGVKIVMVDYIQDLPHMPGMRTSEEHLSASMNAISAIRRDFKMAVILISQLKMEDNRNAEKRPTMQSLRGSSRMTDSSDQIMIMHRKHKNDPKPVGMGDHAIADWHERFNSCELCVVKVKTGPVGVVKLRYNGGSMVFSDPDEGEE